MLFNLYMQRINARSKAVGVVKLAGVFEFAILDL
jgi:hypothetical protein